MNNLASVKTKLGAQIGVYNAMNGLNLLYSSSSKNNQLTLQLSNNYSKVLNFDACANAPDDVLNPNEKGSWLVLTFDDTTISQSALEAVQISKVTIGGAEIGTSDWHLAVQSVKFSSTPLKTQMGLVVYTTSGVVLDENKDLKIELGNVGPNASQEGAAPAYGTLIWCYTQGNGSTTSSHDLGYINIPWMVRDGATTGKTLPLNVVFGQSTYSLLKSMSYQFTNEDIDKADNAVYLTPENYGSSIPNRLGFDLSFGDRHGIAASQSSSLFVEVLTLNPGSNGSLIPGLNATSALVSSLSDDTPLNVDVKDVTWKVDPERAIEENGVYRWEIYFPNNEVTSSNSQDQNPHLEIGDFCSKAKNVQIGPTPICIWWKDIPDYEDGCLWLSAVKQNPVPKVAIATTHKSVDNSSQEVVWVAYAAHKAILSNAANGHSVSLNGVAGFDFVFNLSDFNPKDLNAAEGAYILEALDIQAEVVDQKEFTIQYLPMVVSDLKVIATTTNSKEGAETSFALSATTHNVLSVEVTPLAYGSTQVKSSFNDIAFGPYKGSWNQYFSVVAYGPQGPFQACVLSSNVQPSPIIPELIATFDVSKDQQSLSLNVLEITPDGYKAIDFDNGPIDVNTAQYLVDDWYLDYCDLYSWGQNNKAFLFYSHTNYKQGEHINDFNTNIIEVNWGKDSQLNWSLMTPSQGLGTLNVLQAGNLSSYFPLFPVKDGSSHSGTNKTIVSNLDRKAITSVPIPFKSNLSYNNVKGRYKGRQCLIDGKSGVVSARLSSAYSGSQSATLYFMVDNSFDLGIKFDLIPVIKKHLSDNALSLTNLLLTDFDISVDGGTAYVVVVGVSDRGNHSMVIKAPLNYMYQNAMGNTVSEDMKPIVYDISGAEFIVNWSISTGPIDDLFYLLGLNNIDNRLAQEDLLYPFRARIYKGAVSIEIIAPGIMSIAALSKWGFNLTISPVLLPEPPAPK